MSILDKLREHDEYKAVYSNYNNARIDRLLFDIQHSISRLGEDEQIKLWANSRPAIFAWMLAELEIFKEILEEVKKNNYDK